MISEKTKWVKLNIEKTCEILDSKRIPVNSDEREKRIGEIPYYGANGLQGYIDGFIFDEPLILIAEDGGRFEEYSTRPIAYRIYGKSWVNNHAHILRAKSGYNQEFIFYSLEHKNIQPYIVGGTRAKLNQSELRKIELMLPEAIQEQSKIADVLGVLDQAIEATTVLISKQEKIKTGLIQELLTKGIDKNGGIRSELSHKFKETEIGDVPIEWRICTLKSLMSESAKNGYFKKPELVGAGYKLINVSEIFQPYGINVSEESVERVSASDKDYLNYRVEEGDIFFTRSSLVLEGIAQCNIIKEVPEKTIFECHVIRIRPNKELVLPEFLALQCRAYSSRIQLMRRAKHVTMTTISQPDLVEILIKTPASIDEQRKIVNIIEEHELLLVESIKLKNKLQSMKLGLMNDLVTGKKSVDALFNRDGGGN